MICLQKNADIGMVYGRININPDNFMQEAILSTFTIDSNAIMEPLQEGTSLPSGELSSEVQPTMRMEKFKMESRKVWCFTDQRKKILPQSIIE
jgi:hypothetical protein